MLKSPHAVKLVGSLFVFFSFFVVYNTFASNYFSSSFEQQASLISTSVSTDCFTYTPNYSYTGAAGTTYQYDNIFVNTSDGTSKEIRFAYQNPPTMLQWLAFVHPGLLPSYLIPTPPCLQIPAANQGNLLNNDRYIVANGNNLYIGSGNYQNNFTFTLTKLIFKDKSRPIFGGNYYSFTGAERIIKEDDIIRDVDTNKKIRGFVKYTSANGNPTETFSAPATNCQKISGNGSNKIVFVRASSFNTNINDFLLKVDDMMIDLKKIDPYKTHWDKFSFYVDLKKHVDTGFPQISNIIDVNGNGQSFYDVDPTTNVFSSSCATSGTTETDVVLIKSRFLQPGWATQFGKTIFLNDINVYVGDGNTPGTTPLGMFLARFLGRTIGGLNRESTTIGISRDNQPINVITGNINADFVYQSGPNTLFGGNTTRQVFTNCSLNPRDDYRGLDNRIYGSTSKRGCTYLNGTEVSRPSQYYRPSTDSILTTNVLTMPVTPGNTNLSKFNVISCGYIVAGLRGRVVTRETAREYWPECSNLDTVEGQIPLVPAPTISGITAVSPGQVVTTTGVRFTATGNSVQFINVTDGEVYDVTDIPSLDGTTLVFTVPAEMPISGNSLTYSFKAGALNSSWSNILTVSMSTKKLIAVGGIGSKAVGPMFPFLEGISSGSIKIPLHPDSLARNKIKIKEAINAQLTLGKNVLVAAHSLGASTVFNMRNDFTGRCVEFVYMDPPYNNFWATLPGAKFSAVATEIRRSAEGGIASNPALINWTNGAGKGEAHSPWSYPVYTGNLLRLDNLRTTIENRLAIPAPSGCTFNNVPPANPLTPAPNITNVVSTYPPLSSIRQGESFNITGSGFSLTENDIWIESSTNPSVYYDISSFETTDSNTLTFVLPQYPVEPLDFTPGTYNLKISATGSAWSNILPISIVNSAPTPVVVPPSLGFSNVPAGRPVTISGSDLTPTGNRVQLTRTGTPSLINSKNKANLASIASVASVTASMVATVVPVSTYEITDIPSNGTSLTFTIPSDIPPGTYTMKVAGLNSAYSAGVTITVALSGSPTLNPYTASASLTAGRSDNTITGSGFSLTGNRVQLTTPNTATPPDSNRSTSFLNRIKSSLAGVANLAAVTSAVTDSTLTWEITDILSANGTSITFAIPSGIPSATYTLKVASLNSIWSDPISVRIYSIRLADVVVNTGPTTPPTESRASLIARLLALIAELTTQLDALKAGKTEIPKTPTPVVTLTPLPNILPTQTLPVVCTQEVSQCSDGSFVGRIPPLCAFRACPAFTPPPATVTCPTDTQACSNGSVVSRTPPLCLFPACPNTSTPPPPVVVTPLPPVITTPPTTTITPIQTVTAPTLSATLSSVYEDKAAKWNGFGPGVNSSGKANDFVWNATLTLSSSKTIKSINLTHNTGGEYWSTDNANAYPLVIYHNGNQLNTAYGQTLGTYGAVANNLMIYGQFENPTFSGGTLTITFTDATSLTTTIPASSFSPCMTCGQTGTVWQAVGEIWEKFSTMFMWNRR